MLPQRLDALRKHLQGLSQRTARQEVTLQELKELDGLLEANKNSDAVKNLNEGLYKFAEDYRMSGPIPSGCSCGCPCCG